MSADLLSLAARRDRDGCSFGLCDGSGFTVDEETNTATDCRCRAARIARSRAASLEGRIPKRYRGASFERPPVLGMPEAVVSAVRAYVRNLPARIEEGRGIWFVGSVGTGKTTLAMIVSAAALDAGYSTAIYSLPRLLNLIRDEIGTENSLLDLLDRLSSVDLLHVDDLGAQHTTPWRLEQLYSIVDARYQAGRAIVATTNLMPPDLAEQMGRQVLTTVTEDGKGERSEEHRVVSSDAGEVVGQRIVSRLVETCGDPIPLYGDDRRQAYVPEREDVAAAGFGSGAGL
ncbi:MAG TPA: ATP-binding protein [Solirubrobacteraceae bacterium]|jgi:DNA replication protein DnaC|nr:ATP-binding protein [Solirubrobacteraceae bacterium]